MICPNCGTGSRSGKNHDREMSVCRTCSGILVPEPALAKMVPALAKFAGAPGDSPGIASLPESKRTCGPCGTRYLLLTHRDVELDFCPRCRSVWFDNNELEKVAPSMKKSAPGAGQSAGTGREGTGSTASDAAGEIVAGIIGGVISGIFESIFD